MRRGTMDAPPIEGDVASDGEAPRNDGHAPPDTRTAPERPERALGRQGRVPERPERALDDRDASPNDQNAPRDDRDAPPNDDDPPPTEGRRVVEGMSRPPWRRRAGPSGAWPRGATVAGYLPVSLSFAASIALSTLSLSLPAF
jgi:hypothetical protein